MHHFRCLFLLARYLSVALDALLPAGHGLHLGLAQRRGRQRLELQLASCVVLTDVITHEGEYGLGEGCVNP